MWMPPASITAIQKVRESAPFGRKSRRRIRLRNVSAIADFDVRFSVVTFRLLEITDAYDLKWGWWSRVFEYERVLDDISKLGGADVSSVTIHNTSWGWHGAHVLFKEELDRRYPSVVHSDIRESNLAGTCVYDLTERCPPQWSGAFDFVLSVSTLEEVEDSHVLVLNNLLRMVKPGGHLLLTFDMPGLQLDAIEALVGTQLDPGTDPISGGRSPYPWPSSTI